MLGGLISRRFARFGRFVEDQLAHTTRRRRPLSARAALTALLCLALDDRALFLTDATRLLFQQISAASRAMLGIPGTAAGRRGFLLESYECNIRM